MKLKPRSNPPHFLKRKIDTNIFPDRDSFMIFLKIEVLKGSHETNTYSYV